MASANSTFRSIEEQDECKVNSLARTFDEAHDILRLEGDNDFAWAHGGAWTGKPEATNVPIGYQDGDIVDLPVDWCAFEPALEGRTQLSLLQIVERIRRSQMFQAALPGGGQGL